MRREQYSICRPGLVRANKVNNAIEYIGHFKWIIQFVRIRVGSQSIRFVLQIYNCIKNSTRTNANPRWYVIRSISMRF